MMIISRQSPALALLLAMLSLDLAADFSDTNLVLHPRFPGAAPFILEISGTWPTDCHPGEQKPVIASFDGHAVAIEFEIVVVHVTCNDTATPYRSLVDMSEALRSTPVQGSELHVQVEFQGATLEQSLDLFCPDAGACQGPADHGRLPERGLYVTAGRASEGLLVARQNNIAVIYPLVYDESGRGEWLFSAGGVVEDSYFAGLYRWSGGDCFDCDPTAGAAEMSLAGHLSVLVDRPGVIQVKVNDRLFSEYRKLVYGYHVFSVGQQGERRLTGLEGRWALSENRGTDPPLGDLSNFLPAAFELRLENASPGQVGYLVTTITGAELGQLVCKGDVSGEKSVTFCEFIDPTDQAEPLFRFYQTGPGSLSIEYGRPVIELVGEAPSGKAVRLD